MISGIEEAKPFEKPIPIEEEKPKEEVSQVYEQKPKEEIIFQTEESKISIEEIKEEIKPIEEIEKEKSIEEQKEERKGKKRKNKKGKRPGAYKEFITNKPEETIEQKVEEIPKEEKVDKFYIDI